MNLKEAFRYQKFLDSMMSAAETQMCRADNALVETRIHHIHDVNPDAEDRTEEVEVEELIPIEALLRFMQFLIEQKTLLGRAITHAKNTCAFDLDAAIEANKYRQRVYQGLKRTLLTARRKRETIGTAYKFDVEGKQTAYQYQIEIVFQDRFDREATKKAARDLIAASDEMSQKIDAAMITTVVSYEAPFPVNDSFPDVLADFLSDKEE